MFVYMMLWAYNWKLRWKGKNSI